MTPKFIEARDAELSELEDGLFSDGFKEGSDWAYKWCKETWRKVDFDNFNKDKLLKEMFEALEFETKALSNFCPFNEDLPEGLSPEFYQTLSYKGDRKLLNQHLKAKQALAKYREVMGENK